MAALLPLSLHEALAKLPALTARLEPPESELAHLQVQAFRQSLRTTAKVR